jgi:multimeric flavodoxin WrbA
MRKNKRTLVILSSPRKGSNSTSAALFLANITNPRFEAVDINNLSFHPCTACDKCGIIQECVYKDAAAGLIKKMAKADVVIVGAPIYFTGVPGPFKTFIDRNQVRWYKFNSKLKIENRKLKTGIIILTQGGKNQKYFRPAESEIRSLFAVNGIRTKHVLKFMGMDKNGAILKDEKAVKALKKTAGGL